MQKKVFMMVLTLCVSLQLSAKPQQQPVYLFGVAASFNDSIVYVTDVQLAEGAWVDTKTKFLMSRYEYSYQLRDYLKAIGQPNMTCVTFFATSQKKIEKRLAALRKHYNKKKYNYIIKQLPEADFKFTVPMYNEWEEQLISNKVESQAKKAKKSKAEKAPKDMVKKAPKEKKAKQ